MNKNLILSILTWVVTTLCIGILIALLVKSCAEDAKAAEINIIPQYKVFNDSENLESSPGVKITMGNGFYIFGEAYSNLAPTYKQQQFAVIDLLGLGVGISEPLTDNIKLTMDIGYFKPQTNLTDGTSQEAMIYYINDRVGNKPRHDFDYKVDPNLGMSISLQFNRHVTDHFSVMFNAGYEALTLPTTITAYDNDSGCLNEFNIDTDYSGIVFGFGAKWNF